MHCGTDTNGADERNVLPRLENLEGRNRHDIQRRLKDATGRQFEKGEESFKVLGQLSPDMLEQHLPSFAARVEFSTKSWEVDGVTNYS